MSELKRGIKQSKMAIIIFSENYASSKACLYEMEMILEHHEKSTGHVILPVFYYIEPAEIKQQARDLAAVATEERQIRWAAALKKVAKLGGMPLKHQLESVFIEEIVHVVEVSPWGSLGLEQRNPNGPKLLSMSLPSEE
ncbi:hypothetical protein LguiB_005394 [Lonicera macranthoides]